MSFAMCHLRVIKQGTITVIARFTELEWFFFCANNSVIIASATMNLDQNLVRLTRQHVVCYLAQHVAYVHNKKWNVCFPSGFKKIPACSKDPQSAVLQKAVYIH